MGRLGFRQLKICIILSLIMQTFQQNEIVDNVIGLCRCKTRGQCSDNPFFRIEDPTLCEPDLVVCCENTKSTSINPMSMAATSETRPHMCGYREVDQNTDTNYDEYNNFSWMVSLNTAQAPKFCGGSIIHPQVVLTAAHCLSQVAHSSQILVRAGEWNSNYDESARQVRKVSMVVPHPDYSRGNHWKDLALIFLDSDFIVDKNVGPACLGGFDQLVNVELSGCYLSGWGQTSSWDSRVADAVKEISFSVEANKQRCLDDLTQNEGGVGTVLPFICAYHNETDDPNLFCAGDDGGPLVCPYDSKFVQFGVAVWNNDCRSKKTPALFANIEMELEWIKQEMALHGLTLDSVVNEPAD